jgi:hypothetical protein
MGNAEREGRQKSQKEVVAADAPAHIFAPNVVQEAWTEAGLGSSSKAASFGSSELRPWNVTVTGVFAAGSSETAQSSSSYRNLSPASSVTPEDTDWLELALSHSHCSSTSSGLLSVGRAPHWRNGEAELPSCVKVGRSRSRAAPLGGLAEPLVPPRSIASSVEFQAPALRPNLLGEDWQYDLSPTSSFKDLENVACRSSMTTAASVMAGNGGNELPLPSCCSAASPRSSECDFGMAIVPDVDLKQSCRRSKRHGSDAGSVATIMSGLSTVDRSTEPEDTITVFESAATESLPDFLSISRSDNTETDRSSVLGFETSEPPDSAAALAAASACARVIQAEDDLAFTLERPFAGLEIILEEDDPDNECHGTTAVQLGMSMSRLSFQAHQARATSSWHSVCGHSGPVGDPASHRALASPEPLSAELARAAPCTEVMPQSPYSSRSI